MVLRMDNIKNLEHFPNSVQAEYIYMLRFDKRTGRFSCTCKAFNFNDRCHHIEEFEKKLGMR
jgi:hypothetical protein